MAKSRGCKTPGPISAAAKKAAETMAESAPARVVNLRGLKCPLPALKTRKLLVTMAAGERLCIECTDPLASIDIPNLVRETGDTIEARGKKGKVLTFTIRKG